MAQIRGARREVTCLHDAEDRRACLAAEQPARFAIKHQPCGYGIAAAPAAAGPASDAAPT